ncbi:MAG: hypothetical protein KKG47_15270 [Proteobacteria bacterium]|nr:hypothetical protein [Pseudomonadota bacterium]MBU1737435.1 hypothetical protein [Pseudomonadota bacterium]
MKIFAFLSILTLLTSGCSTIRTTHHSVGLQPPLCEEKTSQINAAVFWNTVWRQDQKEPQIREEMLSTALERFFAGTGCYRAQNLIRQINGRSALLATDTEILSVADSSGADKAIVIKFMEAGPNLILYLSPILWQTRNEIRMNVRIIDVKSRTIEADISTHRFRGGPFTMIGADSLPLDITGSLQEVFTGTDR